MPDNLMLCKLNAVLVIALTFLITYFFLIIVHRPVSLLLFIMMFIVITHKRSHYQSINGADIKISNSDSFPLVSIIVCANNEEKVLPHVLRDLIQIDYPKDKLDIWIVDDASRDNTNIIIKSFVERFSYIKTIHRESNRGFKAGALNDVLHRTKGKFIAIFDADAHIPCDIFSGLQFFGDNKVGAIELKKACYNARENFLTKMIDIEYQQGTKNLSGSGIILRRQALLAVGKWNEYCLTEDFELTLRLMKHGWRIHYPTLPIVEIQAANTYKNFLKQRARWVLGDTICILQHLTLIVKHFFSRNNDFEIFKKQLVQIFVTFFMLDIFLLSGYKLCLILLLCNLMIGTKNFLLDFKFNLNLNTLYIGFSMILLRLHVFCLTFIVFFKCFFRARHCYSWNKFSHGVYNTTVSTIAKS